MEVLIIVAIILLLIPLSMLWPPDSPWSWKWKTSDRLAVKMAEMAGIKSSDVVYDLGCGDAKPLIAIVKKVKCKGVGIEIDPLRYIYSKINVLISGESKRIKLIRGNIFNQDLTYASVVIVYLIPRALDDLLPKFKSLPKGAKIVSKNYEIDLPLEKKDKEAKIFLYTI